MSKDISMSKWNFGTVDSSKGQKRSCLCFQFLTVVKTITNNIDIF